MEDDGRQNFENMCYCIDRETQRDVEIDSGKFCLRTDVFDISEEEAKEFDLRNLYLKHLKRNIKYRTQVLPFCLSRNRDNYKPLVAKEFWLSHLSRAGSMFYMQELLDELEPEDS